jgi:hypothetical protein
VLKRTGSYEQASYAIQDTPDMVAKHYGRFLPQDKAALAARVLNQVWEVCARFLWIAQSARLIGSLLPNCNLTPVGDSTAPGPELRGNIGRPVAAVGHAR